MVQSRLHWDGALLSQIIQLLPPEESLCKLELHTVSRTFYAAVKQTIPRLIVEYQSEKAETPKDNEALRSHKLRSILSGVDEYEIRKIYAMN